MSKLMTITFWINIFAIVATAYCGELATCVDCMAAMIFGILASSPLYVERLPLTNTKPLFGSFIINISLFYLNQSVFTYIHASRFM